MKINLIKRVTRLITLSAPSSIVITPKIFIFTLTFVIYDCYHFIKMVKISNYLVKESFVLLFGKSCIKVYKNYILIGKYAFNETYIR